MVPSAIRRLSLVVLLTAVVGAPAVGAENVVALSAGAGAGLPALEGRYGIALIPESTFEPEWLLTAAPGRALASGLTLQSGTITGYDPVKPRKEKPGKKPKRVKAVPSDAGLGPERARILLRSLTVPGWGQATLGRRGSSKVFLLAEAGIWGAFTSFKVQQAQRTQSYLLTARIGAGVDLDGRDDEYRRIVGAFASSDEYNLLVVTRDAANLYLSDPTNFDLAGYHAYIDSHSLKGDLAWSWSDEESFRRYSRQRKFAQKAGLRANTALGLAIANRLVSALHAARAAGHGAAPVQQGWHLDVDPGLQEPGRFRAALTTRF